jgi:sugar O-acyltransferase (sialic acid O-acetyltransferase NeuD family)
MKKLVIFGTGSLARLAYIHFSNAGQYEVEAFTVNAEFIVEPQVFGLDVVPFEHIEETYAPEFYAMFIAVGYRKLNNARARLYHEGKAKGYELASCVAAKDINSEYMNIGDNCFIMPTAFIQPFADIGNNVVIWDSGYIGYQTHIGDHSYIAPAAVIAGNVQVGEYCFIGANSTIRDGLTIAPECVIGAGAVVIRDTERGRVYRGRRAEVLPYRSSEQKYFQ